MSAFTLSGMISPFQSHAKRPPQNPRNRTQRMGHSPQARPGQPIFLDDGSMLLLREIAPGDVQALIRAFTRMTPEQVRSRVFHALRELPEPVARQMCDVDPERVVALVATDPDGGEIRAEARIHLDPMTECAELALAIDPAYTGKGLGTILIEHLIEEAKSRHVREIWGDTLADNSAMLSLTRRLGFTHHTAHDDASLVRISLVFEADSAHGSAVNR